MASRTNRPRPGRPATTPEGRESQLVAKAYDLAERQIEEGTATAQVVVHFLRLGTQQAKLEQEKIKHENKLLEARADNLSSQANSEQLYKDAINAFRSYSGFGGSDESEG